MDKQQKILITCIILFLVSVMWYGIANQGQYKSYLGERISQGIRCLATGQDCPK